MKKIKCIPLFIAALFLFPGALFAANEIPVQLRVENESGTDLVATIQVPDECDVIDTTTTTPTHFTGYKAICALQAAQEQSLITYQATNWGFGFALDSINSTVNAADWSKTWLLYQNLKDPGVGIDGFSLQADDELLLAYAGWPNAPLQLSLTTTTVQEGSTLLLEALMWDAGSQTFAPLTNTVTFHVDGDSYTSATDGTFHWTAASAGQKQVWAEGPGFTRSAVATLNVTALPAPKDITLRVETASSTLATATVSAPYQCDVVDSAGVSHLFTGHKAICALTSALSAGSITDFQVTDWGFAFALDSLNGIANAADWSQTWLLFQNLKDPGVGIDAIILEDQDELLLTYAAWPTIPLRITAAPSAATAGSAVDISVETWDAAGSAFSSLTGVTSTVWIDGVPLETTSGTVAWIADDGTASLFAEAPGATRSAVVNFFATAPTPPTPPASGGGGGCSSCGSSPETVNIAAAIAYLQQKQQADGSILGSNLYSDWSAIAFASYSGQNAGKEMLKQYLLSDPSAIVGFNEAADYARRAMALLALGINPYSGTQTNYIEKLVSTFDGSQFGEASLVNDDIFALFPLLHSGYGSTDSLIASTTAHILSKQESDGSWGGVDMTAAAVQALAPLTMLPDVSTALAAGKAYLHAEQRANGSFLDNADSTSWVLQAIATLGETESLWVKSTTPGAYLAGKQLSDGSIGDSATPESVRTWSTAYAVPAAQNKSWHSILSTVAKPTNQPVIPTTGGTGPVDTATATTTTPVATSTIPAVLLVVTSTTAIVETPIVLTTELAVPEVRTAVQAVAGVSIEASDEDADETVSEETAVTQESVEVPSVETVADKHDATVTEEVSFVSAPVAKGVFATTAVAGGSLGLYLIWKFLQGLV